MELIGFGETGGAGELGLNLSPEGRPPGSRRQSV